MLMKTIPVSQKTSLCANTKRNSRTKVLQADNIPHVYTMHNTRSAKQDVKNISSRLKI